jgi:mycofactocin precursor
MLAIAGPDGEMRIAMTDRQLEQEPIEVDAEAGAPVEELVVEELLVEDVSIDGLCGVY